ncbi:23S rRNA (pseudouridine(1915)-N(3))-methyltransferase RlmH [Butyrivibrio sp. YAB3001]|uniref:23S rRNA (pseudouridine(1915)-N(3))-methyltransferase RlmH n=1 Tax=Butyrivibrio sp. YAB3001 TaxID=1520812 RepID=UPI0008F65B1B|nr:23S rRNA (pseudouridine(1915)-N(3))-methyltransferase RlmH [Butyrivibrio sp. YAB3001]SFD02575.1 23S rRNA (pseudouridine1915-N3)-methyltransferase [Butyrivibrio sp. YAB3001]
MSNITIICVGKIKEKYWNDAISEYSKRLSRYCKLSIIEVADEKTPENAPKAIEEQIKKKEADRIISNLDSNAHICALSIGGKRYSSEGFSDYIADKGIKGISNIQFIIGGSLGLHESVLSKVDDEISFSDMTFPHQMMRVILLEQIYRGFRIMRGEPYHK